MKTTVGERQYHLNEISPDLWRVEYEGLDLGRILQTKPLREAPYWRTNNSTAHLPTQAAAIERLHLDYMIALAEPAPKVSEAAPPVVEPTPLATAHGGLTLQPGKPPAHWLNRKQAIAAYGRSIGKLVYDVEKGTIQGGRFKAAGTPGSKNGILWYFAPPVTPVAVPPPAPPKPPQVPTTPTETGGQWVRSAEAARLLGLGPDSFRFAIRMGKTKLQTRRVMWGKRTVYEVWVPDTAPTNDVPPEPPQVQSKELPDLLDLVTHDRETESEILHLLGTINNRLGRLETRQDQIASIIMVQHSEPAPQPTGLRWPWKNGR